ncbi:MAG: homoserine kinase [Pseudomonadota bacterium]
MAVYTRVDETSLTKFLSLYGKPPATVFKGIAEGVENSNYLLESGGERFILTLYEKRVAAEDLPYFLSLMDHVMEKGIPAAGPVRDLQGETLQTLCGRPAALIHFLEGMSPDTPTLPQTVAAGAALAQFHLATEDFSMKRPNALGPQGWPPLIEQSGERLNDIEAGLYQELTEVAQECLDQWPEDLPKGTIHADLFPDNIFFNGEEVCGLIDFYFACTDFFAYDLAICMNSWTPEGSLTADNAHSFLRGYEQVRALGEDEMIALPLFLKGAALRFYATRAYDWLHQIPGSLVRVKDPSPYLHLLRHHRDHPTAFLENIS